MLTLDQLLAGIVIPLDKPRQWSSFQAVSKAKAAVRSLYDIKKFKIGHAGTLDPLATGLLLICVGKATKQIETLQQGDKVYTGTMVLGATTPCFDLERPIDAYRPASHITRMHVEDAAARLTGEIDQIPPIFSAVKIDGQRAYQIGRETAEPQSLPAAKRVTVYEFQITDFRAGSPLFTPPAVEETSRMPQTNLYNNPLGTVPEGLPQADFRIRCGKGTYIRSLVRDLGEMLGCGAFLASLRREQVGSFDVSSACSVDNIRQYLEDLTM